MNRRRSVKPHFGFGTIVLLVVAAVAMAAAGVFHAYVKNRQINVAREIQGVEDRISQHRLDITTLEVALDDQLNPILINDRLTEMSSDLRRIPAEVVRKIQSQRSDTAVDASDHDPLSLSALAAPVSTAAGEP